MHLGFQPRHRPLNPRPPAIPATKPLRPLAQATLAIADAVARVLEASLLAAHRRGRAQGQQGARGAGRRVERRLEPILALARRPGSLASRAAGHMAAIVELEVLQRELSLL